MSNKLPTIKWKMGRLRERAGEGYCSPLVWWVRETEALNKRFYETIKIDESEQIENEMNEKDQQALAIILKHRLTLWT